MSLIINSLSFVKLTSLAKNLTRFLIIILIIIEIEGDGLV